MSFDPTLPDDQPYAKFDYVGWSQEHGDVQGNKPDDMPEALGKPVKRKPVELTKYTDAAHAGNVINLRSHMGIIIFLNKAPIRVYSKLQSADRDGTK